MQHPPVLFTTGAIREIKRLYSTAKENTLLRIGIKNGGCAGYSYILEFDTKSDKDIQYSIDNIPLVMNAEHIKHVENMQIDYVSGLNNRGFTFENPNAKTTCGCGTSFS